MNFLHTLICGAGVGFPQIGYIWEIQSQLESHRLIQVEKASEIPKPNPPHLLSVSHISMALEEVEGAHPMPGCGKCTQLVPTLVVALQHLRHSIISSIANTTPRLWRPLPFLQHWGRTMGYTEKHRLHRSLPQCPGFSWVQSHLPP